MYIILHEYKLDYSKDDKNNNNVAVNWRIKIFFQQTDIVKFNFPVYCERLSTECVSWDKKKKK